MVLKEYFKNVSFYEKKKKEKLNGWCWKIVFYFSQEKVTDKDLRFTDQLPCSFIAKRKTIGPFLTKCVTLGDITNTM